MSLKHSVIKSFPFAIDGLRTAFHREPNFRFHCLIAVVALSLSYFFHFSPTELAILILIISLVVTLELINTMLEALVDLVSPEIKPAAKIAKDVSAGAVLICAISSVLIGILLYLPKIISLLY